MGRKKEPTNLIKMKGKSHYSNAYLEAREKTEIKVEEMELVIPDGLTEVQAGLYEKWYKNLSGYGLTTHLEESLLTRFVKAKTEYDNLSEKMESETDTDTYRQLLGLRLRVSDEIRRCEGDLGMNAFSRMRMTLPEKEKPEPTTTERLFGEL